MTTHAQRTYGAIERVTSGDLTRPATWAITQIEPHVAIRLKQVFPSINKTSRPPFRLTGGPQLDADLQWFMSRYPLRISMEDAACLAERKTLFVAGQSEIGAILSKSWSPPKSADFRGEARAYDYQMQAAVLARRTGRLLLMDEMGLGKTVSALAAIVDPAYLPALVVPQIHLTMQWYEKVQEFTHLRTHIVKQVKPYELPPADVIICPYSKLAGWVDYAESAEFKTVVFDEVQELRTGASTSKGAAAFRFARRAKMVIGLSGTPIYNYGEEIWRVCDFLEAGCLGNWWDFVREWCNPGPGGKWVVMDPQALGTYLRESHLALRRTRHDVGHERKFANSIVRSIATDAASLDDEASAMRALAQQVVSGTFTERGQAAREFDLRLRHATGLAKAAHVAAFVKVLLSAGEPVLLCGWHRDVYDVWMRDLAAHRPLLYTGSESPAQKERTKRAFITGESDLMIMSLRSGAGLDGLQRRCRTIVFGELDWSPKVHEQCIARLDRPGQEHDVDAIYLVSDDGSDPAVMSVLGLKASQAHGIVDPLVSMPTQQNDATRIRQLAEQYLAGYGENSKPVPTGGRAPAPVTQAQASLF